MVIRSLKIKLSRAFVDKDWAKNFVYSVINTRPLDSVYRVFYNRAVQRRLGDLKLKNLMVTLEGFNGCNARCVMCPYKIMTRPKEVMPMDLFRAVVSDCVSNGIRTFNLNFYNEPLLDPLLFDRIKYLKEKDVYVKFYSNGSVMDEKKVDQLLTSGLDMIDFSVDGASREVYEKIRVGLDYDRMQRNINWVLDERKKRGLKYPKINLVYTRQNLNWNEMEDFKKMWEGRVDKIFWSLDDNRNNTGPLKFGLGVKRAPIAYPCLKLWTELVVMSDGRVALCCIDYDGKVILGDFKKQTLQEIWDSPGYKKIRDLHVNYKADQIQLCKTCLHPWRLNVHSWW
jgi:radical SAM protein with 4Fe4S-binding SPASM domain